MRIFMPRSHKLEDSDFCSRLTKFLKLEVLIPSFVVTHMFGMKGKRVKTFKVGNNPKQLWLGPGSNRRPNDFQSFARTN